ncbi:hypothetical protein JCM10213_009105 [Rhodosporidiobolus nylandii]
MPNFRTSSTAFRDSDDEAAPAAKRPAHEASSAFRTPAADSPSPEPEKNSEPVEETPVEEEQKANPQQEENETLGVAQRTAVTVPTVEAAREADEATFVQEEIDFASLLQDDFAAADVAEKAGSALEVEFTRTTETLKARASLAGSAVLIEHEQSSLSLSATNYLSFPNKNIANAFLTPGGDIRVNTGAELTDSPETNPLLRLNGTFAKSVHRLARLSILSPPLDDSDEQHTFSLATQQKRATVVASAISERSLGYMGFIVLRYLEFCDEEDVPLENRFPAPRNTLLMFLSSLAGTLAADTIRTYKNGLRTWHTMHDLPFDLPESAWLLTYKGLKKQQPAGKDPRPPATFHDLLAIRKHLDLSNGHDACFWAACTTAFWAMTRPGDVTIKNLSSFKPDVDATRGDLRFVEATQDFPEHVIIHLPFDKVLGKEGDDLILVHQSKHEELDPIFAMRNHLKVNDPSPDDFLFSSLPWGKEKHRANEDLEAASDDEDDWEDVEEKPSLRPLTSSHFRKTVNHYLPLENRPIIAGHSWRIGGATFYLLAGIHPDFIRKIGRWRSDAFYRYWRKIKILAALNLQDATFVDIGETVETRKEPQKKPAPPKPTGRGRKNK